LLPLHLKIGYWIKCSEDIMFNFIHYKDVALATHQVVTKFKTSKNKIYNVSNDFSQNNFIKITIISLKKI
jgi:hypothetical protein